MAENTEHAAETTGELEVAPGPHLASRALTTRRMMLDVLIALLPATAVAIWVFQWYAAAQIAVCVASCVATEWLLMTLWWRKGVTVKDCSAVVTGLILAFSIPAACPWWVSVIASFVAIALGKVVFGGVGMNIFNPAMVGRAFVMVSFAGFLAAGGYVARTAGVVGEVGNVTQTVPWLFTRHIPDAMSQATPMTAAFKAGKGFDLMALFLGNTNGSMGETSALACLIGGLYLCLRRTAAWQIPLGAIVGLGVLAGIDNLVNPAAEWTALHHLLGGAFLLGAFFIVTDPVSSPLTPWGRFLYGVLFGVLVMLVRLLTNYPEGVMFSVLLVNAIAPLLNRWTIPRPVGGPVPVRVKK